MAKKLSPQLGSVIIVGIAMALVNGHHSEIVSMSKMSFMVSLSLTGTFERILICISLISFCSLPCHLLKSQTFSGTVYILDAEPIDSVMVRNKTKIRIKGQGAYQVATIDERFKYEFEGAIKGIDGKFTMDILPPPGYEPKVKLFTWAESFGPKTQHIYLTRSPENRKDTLPDRNMSMNQKQTGLASKLKRQVAKILSVYESSQFQTTIILADQFLDMWGTFNGDCLSSDEKTCVKREVSKIKGYRKKSTDLLYLLNQCDRCWANNNLDSAWTYISECIKIKSNDLNIQKRHDQLQEFRNYPYRARQAYENGEYSTAKELFKQCLGFSNDSVAISDFEMEINDCEWVDSVRSLGIAALDGPKDYVKALDYFTTVRNRNPHDKQLRSLTERCNYLFNIDQSVKTLILEGRFLEAADMWRREFKVTDGQYPNINARWDTERRLREFEGNMELIREYEDSARWGKALMELDYLQEEMQQSTYSIHESFAPDLWDYYLDSLIVQLERTQFADHGYDINVQEDAEIVFRIQVENVKFSLSYLNNRLFAMDEGLGARLQDPLFNARLHKAIAGGLGAIGLAIETYPNLISCQIASISEQRKEGLAYLWIAAKEESLDAMHYLAGIQATAKQCIPNGKIRILDETCEEFVVHEKYKN